MFLYLTLVFYQWQKFASSSHDYTNAVTTELLDLSRSSWLMAAVRMAVLCLGKPTCFMNERPSPVSCLGCDLFEEGLHWHKPCMVFLRMDVVSWSIRPVWIFKIHSCLVNESFMGIAVVNHSFHTFFHFSFFSWMEMCSIHLSRNCWTLHFVVLNAQQCFQPLRFFSFQ